MEKQKKEHKDPSFSKAHILKMQRYIERRDLLSVLLEEDKSYTHAEIEKIIEEYFKK